MDIGNCQDRFGRFFWFKNASNYLDVKLKVFKKDNNKEFRLVQNLTMGEADFNQFMRLRKQLVIAAEKFATEENLTPVLIPTLFKDMDEQLKVPRKVVDAVERPNRKICVTLYSVDKLESSHARVGLFPRKTEESMFQQIVFVNCKLEELICILDVLNSVYNNVIANKPISKFLQKVIAFN